MLKNAGRCFGNSFGMVVASDAMAECDGIYLGIRGGVAEPDIGAKTYDR